MSDFEGHDVIAYGIEMPGASGGLNKALRIDKLVLHHGQTVRVVIEAEVVKVRHDIVKDTDALERTHVLKVQNAAVVGEELVAEILDAQRKRNEEAQGIHALPFPEEEGEDTDDEAADGAPVPHLQEV